MKLSSLLKYSSRFLILQVVLTYITIFFFNSFLIPTKFCELCTGNSFRLQINSNLWEDRNRFFTFLPERFTEIEYFLGFFIFIFLIILYSTKFYTYVNELSYSLDRNYLDEYISIYLLWTSTFFIFITIFRISSLISRGYLIVFTFLIPIILLLFRNSEYLSSLLGRSVTSENFITFNLEEDSMFRNLRIMTFRKDIGNFSVENMNNTDLIIEKIDKLNKEINVNLIVLNINFSDKIDENLENYLIKLNKKVLIISKEELIFKNYFINRKEILSDYYLTYFNNDIQYGAKYILKRFLDIILAIIGMVIFSPLYLAIIIYIYLLDGSETIIKQDRVGLHGRQFKMYKFRTMKKGSHKMREELEELNQNDKAIFKIENDPRIINGTQFLRNYSLDELPQFFNVLKGEMSIVGPRPLFTEDTKLFDSNYMRRLNVMPGITGLLQINERNTSDFERWYKYDIEYIENWSLFLDFKIIMKTPFSLFSSRSKGV
ncbi:MAG: sugar transferase [Candidatus Actinomarina sp.]